MTLRLLLDSTTAKEVLQVLKNGEMEITTSFDLGITTSTYIIDPARWDVSKLESIVKDSDTLYFWEDGEFFKAAISDQHFYKLHPTGSGSPPALLIDGVLMHRVKDMDPMRDAELKAQRCARTGFDMLEICTGLGYSTISCLAIGVKSITTIEKESNVIELARLNPWSQKLFIDERVSLIEGDASEHIQKFQSARFDAVLHDPPRFTMGTELYTSEFYAEIFRVLKKKGLLYHYVGTPGKKHRRIDLQKGIMKRLRDVGFSEVKRESITEGILAKKR